MIPSDFIAQLDIMHGGNVFDVAKERVPFLKTEPALTLVALPWRNVNTAYHFVAVDGSMSRADAKLVEQFWRERQCGCPFPQFDEGNDLWSNWTLCVASAV